MKQEIKYWVFKILYDLARLGVVASFLYGITLWGGANLLIQGTREEGIAHMRAFAVLLGGTVLMALVAYTLRQKLNGIEQEQLEEQQAMLESMPQSDLPDYRYTLGQFNRGSKR